MAAIRHAVSRGVNWVDTAAVYGYGHSEEVVARALAEIPTRERPLVFTKCGLRWNDADRMAFPVRDSSPARIRQECEDSLRRLRTETIDLYQFHWPDETGVPLEESWGEMLKLVHEGKVRWAGVSNFDAARIAKCEAVGHVQSLQPPFSMIRRDVGASEIPWCAQHDSGVIVYSPMQSGLLTDSFTADRVGAFAADDWRRRSPEYQPPKLERNLALRDALKPIAAKHGVSVAAIAVAWTLAWPITAAIVGARSPQQVDGWIAAAVGALDADDLEAVAAAIDGTGAGTGPHRPRVVADPFPAFFAALEARQRAELTFQEIRRALQALSSLYVERRERLSGRRSTGPASVPPSRSTTGRCTSCSCARSCARSGRAAARLGASSIWAAALGRPAPRGRSGARRPHGRRDRQQRLGRRRGALDAAAARSARQGQPRRRGVGGAAGPAARHPRRVHRQRAAGRRARALLPRLLDAAEAGSPVLIVEPIARRMSPWWPEWAGPSAQAGGREDEWRCRPPCRRRSRCSQGGRARRAQLTGRSLSLPGAKTGRTRH